MGKYTFDDLRKELEQSNSASRLAELSTQVSSAAQAARMLEADSISYLAPAYSAALKFKDPTAEWRASLEAMNRERNSFMEGLRVSAAAQAALRASISVPAMEHQKHLWDSIHSAAAAASAPILELQRQARESSRFLETANFRLPAWQESTTLASKMFEAYNFPKTHFKEAFRTFSETMHQMKSPWLNIQRELQSTRAFTALQDLGRVVNAGKLFEATATEQMRDALGDWRYPITLPDSVVELETRTALYRNHGFDTELTEFPADAFDEAVTIARIKHPPPPLIITFQSPIFRESAGEEEGHAMRNFAHDYLQRFETQVRQFIATQMTKAFGADWEKQHVPPDLLADWVKKREKHRDYGGADFPLIAFADFTHYEPIIVRKDNWSAVFAGIFRKKESVIESLQRLYPIRLATMHARPVGQADLLFLYAEVLRLCTSMGVASSDTTSE
jgi:hypothetical protein